MTTEGKPAHSKTEDLVLRVTGQPTPPDFWEELKKRAKKFARRWAIRLGTIAVLIGSNYTSYRAGQGVDLTGLFNLAAFFFAVGFIYFLLSNITK